jgi:hypothetical protein
VIIGDVCMNEEREFIEIVNADGSIDTVEFIGTVESKRDNKIYALLTEDEVISDEVNVFFGIVYEEDGKQYIDYLTDKEEIDYVNSLLDELE